MFNGGKDYDVVNPPQIEISAGTGTTALVEPIIEGSVKQVFVDPQDFDVQNIASVSVTGGNGSGCVLQPVMAQRFQEEWNLIADHLFLVVVSILQIEHYYI